MFTKIDNFVQSILFHLDPFVKLFFRLIVAAVFIPAGWGKLQNLQKTIDFFQELHIPMPQLQAPMVASLEFGLGIFILIGFFTRLSTLPLMGTMVVALMTAHREDIVDISSLLDQTPFLYLAILIAVLFVGPGTLSADQMFFRRK